MAKKEEHQKSGEDKFQELRLTTLALFSCSLAQQKILEEILLLLKDSGASISKVDELQSLLRKSAKEANEQALMLIPDFDQKLKKYLGSEN